jgi:acetoin utilization protein AcuB
MIVADLMTRNPQTVGPSDSLEVAHEKMQVGRFRQVPVVHEGKLVGVLTDRDMRQHVGQLTHTRVDAVMSGHPFSVRPSTPVEEAAHLLVANRVGSLPVLEHGKLVGIIIATDMLQALEAILGGSADGGVRIDLDAAGYGEIAAAISLVRTICPVLGVGTYRRKGKESEILYVRVAAADAQRAAHALEHHGFKLLAVHS